tara:strand:- start:178 stop:477 length:300 start_codon:yes stop_codon:yes gene_type:complete
MITAILTLIDSIGISDFTDYIVHTTMGGIITLIDGITEGGITTTLMTCIIALLFLIAHLLDLKFSYPTVEEQLGSTSMVEEEKRIMQMESTKMEEDMKN